MESKNNEFQSAIQSIKLLHKIRGSIITDEEIANKLKIPYIKFKKYLDNKDVFPKELINDLLSAYGLKRIISRTEVVRK